MKLPPRRFYEFSSYRVDVAERRLWCDGEIVPLTPKVFDILLALLENAGRTVRKDSLMDKVWSDTFVEEGNLNRNISTLRKVLGDDGQTQKLIKTIPKRGYRFTSEVREFVEDSEELLLEDTSRIRMRLTEEVRREFTISDVLKSRVLIGIAVLCLVTGVSLWFWFSGRSDAKSSATQVAESDRKEALRLYEQGRALWNTRDGKDLHRATVLTEQAIAKDPGLAKAHAALGDAYAFDSRLWRKAEASARKAIHLDPSLGEPHATIGLVKMMWELRFLAAEQELKEAIALAPDYATAHQWYAINLHAIGHSGHAAVSEMRKAQELDPESLSINADLCQTLYFVGRIEEAIDQCNRTLLKDPRFHNAFEYLFEIYSTSGRHEKAVEVFFGLEAVKLSPIPSDTAAKLRSAFERGGFKAFLRELVGYRLNLWPRQHFKIAKLYAWMGNEDKMFEHLELAFEEKSFGLFLLASDPAFSRYQQDARFKQIYEMIRAEDRSEEP